MNELKELLDNISHVLWFIYAITLFMFYCICKSCPGTKSSFITVIIVLLSNTLMLGYQVLLDWYIAGHPGFNPVVNFFWYMGFASFDLISMTVLYRVHLLENVRIGSLGQYASVSFFVLGCINLLQYAEIIIFKTDAFMDKIYTIGIPTINIATSIVCFSLALLSIYHIYISKKGLNGLSKWTI